MGTWFWLGLGLLFLVVELFTGAFVLVFFAFSALVVAIASAVTVLEPVMAYAIFALAGVVSLLTLRKRLLAHFTKNEKPLVVNDEGNTLTLPVGLEPGAEAQVSYQGTVFTAINASTARIEPGTRVRIVGVLGVKLRVERAS